MSKPIPERLDLILDTLDNTWQAFVRSLLSDNGGNNDDYETFQKYTFAKVKCNW